MTGRELHDGHRRSGREIVRIHHLQHVFGEARELRVDFQLNSRRKEGEALQQALHVRVCAFESVEPEPAGNLGELLGKLPAQLPYVLQFAVVIRQQALIHQSPFVPESSETEASPVSRSRSVLRNKRRGSGCAQSSAWILKFIAL